MSRARHNPDFGTKDLLTLGLVGGAAYLVYLALKQLPQAATTLTAPAAQMIANAWLAMTLAPPQAGVLGNVVFPDGTATPLANLYASGQIKLDSNSMPYTLYNGVLYQIGQSDSNGNWPASMVLDPEFGVTGTTW